MLQPHLCAVYSFFPLFSGYYYTILPHGLLIRCQHVRRAHALNEKGPATFKGNYNMPVASDTVQSENVLLRRQFQDLLRCLSSHGMEPRVQNVLRHIEYLTLV